jgi:lipoyl(octanoyl) transferase
VPYPARLLDLGGRPYDEALRLQQGLVADRQAGAIPDTLVLVEHPHVITLGRAAKPENVLAPGDTPVIPVERGGDVTYHGPGQIVAYPIFQLREDERDLHAFLRGLEEAILRTVDEAGIAATRVPGKTGVWTATEPPRKLASIGIAVKKWVCMHGLALNVNTDLARFAAINPCGMAATVMTSMARERGQACDLAAVKAALAGHLGRVLGRAF